MFAARVDQLVFDFNCRPSSYIDPSWLPPEVHSAMQRLVDATDSQSRGQVDLWLLEHFDLSDKTDFDFTHPASRLLLLDSAALRDMALLLGLSSLTHLLRTWVTRSRQLQIREAVGDDVFSFFNEHVLTWQPVSRPVVGKQVASKWAESGAWLQAARRFGTTLLLLSCGAVDHPSIKRAQLKFPKAHGELIRTKPLSPARQQAVLEFCIGCVVHHRHSPWHWLF
jgi:YOP proteins translocation protein K (YscK)